MTQQLATQQENDRMHPVMRVLMSEKTRAGLLAIAPKCDPDELMARARLAVVEKPDLGECTPESILLSIKRAASSGFAPSSFGRDWYLVPRFNKKVGGKEANFQVSYMGYIHLAKEAGLPFIKAEMVHEKDDFALGADDKGCHIVHNFNPKQDRGPWVGAYSMTKDLYGTVDFEWMTKAQIMAVRARSTAGSGPWVTDEEEMAKKTVLRRHSKRWNISNSAKEAISADDETMDLSQPMVKTSRIVLEEPEAPPPAEKLPEPEQERDQNGEFIWK